jgi:outer membrane murein-binding lipoprotein Lpp
MGKKGLLLLLAVIISISVMYGCSSGANKNPAAEAVEIYLQALVNQDLNRMITVSCGAWETQAKQEYDSFAAVKLNLNNLSCQEINQEGDTSSITCNGSIIANYGAEDLEIDIADRIFKVVKEGGEWRMCGYVAQ